MDRYPVLSYLRKAGESFSFSDLCADLEFNYELTKVPLWAHTMGEDGELLKVMVEHEMGVYRPSTRRVIGVVGSGYKITKNIEAAEFSKDLAGNHGAKYTAYGAPNWGEQMYLVMEMPESLDLEGLEIRNRLLITSSHNGERQIEVYAIPMHATSGYVLTANINRLVRIKHTKNSTVRMAQAKRVAEQIEKEWTDFQTRFRLMRSVTASPSEAETFFNGLIEGGDTRHENIRKALLDLFFNGVHSVYPACRGTVLGLWMACIEYADSHKTVRKSKHLDPNSATLFSSLLGDSARLKAASFAAALNFSRKEVIHVG